MKNPVFTTAGRERLNWEVFRYKDYATRQGILKLGFIYLDIEDPTRRGQDIFTLSKGH